MDFKPGDLVRLKSGGPLMTVEQLGKKAYTEEDAVWCVWSEKVGNKQVVQRETFPPVVLEKAEKPSPVGSLRVTRA
jgi:uncharacterized protein YodC (DUF2158 family)